MGHQVHSHPKAEKNSKGHHELTTTQVISMAKGYSYTNQHPTPIAYQKGRLPFQLIGSNQANTPQAMKTVTRRCNSLNSSLSSKMSTQINSIVLIVICMLINLFELTLFFSFFPSCIVVWVKISNFYGAKNLWCPFQKNAQTRSNGKFWLPSLIYSYLA